MEAYDDVVVRLETRTGTGRRLTYFTADERYLMTGVPVRVVEECRVTTGKTLTFFRSTDRILVDGNEEIRTQTLSGGNCSAAAAQVMATLRTHDLTKSVRRPNGGQGDQPRSGIR